MFRLFIIFSVALLTACSARGPLFQPITAKDGNALLYVFRPAKKDAKARASGYELNGQKFASLNSNGYSTIELKPGSYTLSRNWPHWVGDNPMNPEVLKVNFSVKSGEVIFIRHEPFVDVWLCGLNRICMNFHDALAILPEEHGASQIKRCRYQAPLSVDFGEKIDTVKDP